MQRIGVPASDWTIGYGERYEIDGLQVHEIRGGGRYTARAVASIGQLILNEGSWHGERLIDRNVIRSIAPDARDPLPEVRAGLPRPGVGGWFTNVEGQWPSLPHDALVGAGAGHKILLVVPSEDLVVVRLGGAFDEHEAFGEHDFWSQAERHLFDPVMAAMTHPP
jgi:CubicO group peptidase (beta-lactamase class C family)